MLDYESLPLPDGKNPIDVQAQQDIIRRLARRYSALLDILNTVQYVIDHQIEFIFTPEVTVANIKNQIKILEQALDSVKGAASNCFNDFRTCRFSVDDQPPEIKLPDRKPHTTVVTIPNWGFEGDIDGEPLGLNVQEVLRSNPGHLHGGGFGSDVISISPPAGTVVPWGSTVTVTIWGREPPSDE